MAGEENLKVFEYSSGEFISASIPWPKDGETFTKSKVINLFCT